MVYNSLMMQLGSTKEPAEKIVTRPQVLQLAAFRAKARGLNTCRCFTEPLTTRVELERIAGDSECYSEKNCTMFQIT